MVTVIPTTYCNCEETASGSEYPSLPIGHVCAYCRGHVEISPVTDEAHCRRNPPRLPCAPGRDSQLPSLRPTKPPPGPAFRRPGNQCRKYQYDDRNREVFQYLQGLRLYR